MHQRLNILAADDLLGVVMPVLDHGSVQLIDYMGGDLAIAQAAWVDEVNSRGKNDDEAQRGVINYMLRQRVPHTSPFERTVMQFRITMPIFGRRQHDRHRTSRQHERLNEQSGRYTEYEEVYYLPERQLMLGQSKRNHQASSNVVIDEPGRIMAKMDRVMSDAFAVYREALAAGLSRERARIVLPVATYTKLVWQMDANNLMNYLNQRLDTEHAQAEIVAYAERIAEAFHALAPIAYEAFERHVLRAVKFSADKWTEHQDYVRRLEEALAYYADEGIYERDSDDGSPVAYDEGQRAREAIKSRPKEELHV